MAPIPIEDLDKESTLEKYATLRKEIHAYLDKQFEEDLAYTDKDIYSIRNDCIENFSGKVSKDILQNLMVEEMREIVFREKSIRGTVYTRRAAEQWKGERNKRN